jgi:hypothetical protein
MTSPQQPSTVEAATEEWGLKYLRGKFTFEPMWLDAKADLVAAINELIDRRVDEAEADMARHIARLAEMCAEPREERLNEPE